MGAIRRSLPLVVWVLGLAGGTALFHTLGDGPLAPPPLDPSAWAGWAAGRDPLVATFAILRLVVLAGCWYLVGSTSIGILARLLRAARMVHIADRLTMPAVRRLLQRGLGVTMATAVVAAAVPFTPPGPASTITATAVAAEPGSGRPPEDHPRPVPLDLLDRSVPDGPVLGEDRGVLRDDREMLREDRQELREDEAPRVDERRVPSREVVDRTVPAPAAAEGRLPGSGLVPPGGQGGGVSEPRTDNQPETWTDNQLESRTGGSGVDVDQHEVVSGDSLWSIAEQALATTLHRAPTEREIAAYWLQVIEANRADLADPDEPDLIFPGQRFVLPPQPASR